ncbi:MAG: acetamidase/formamidase family protein [Clostridiales bacterium]|nr:acetamidase/formamidase family protein [Clostridiales bacterium]
MQKLTSESHIFSFSRDEPPALRVKSGETVQIETMDCFSNQIVTESDKLDRIDWDHVNPATGPVFVEGAEPGDTLKVDIETIELAGQGVMATGKGFGVLGHKMEGLYEKIVPITGDEAVFSEKIRIPLNKMIGVIGVAPSGEPVPCGTPGSHGGNMDNKRIAEKTSVYLPVAAEGALFSLGDVHAVMGDGEIGVTGVEAPALVTVKFEVLKDMGIKNPFIETDDIVATIASHEEISKAITTAVEDMERLLTEGAPMETHEMAMLLSAVGNVEVCQVVDPLNTVRFSVPLWIYYIFFNH